MTRDDFDFIGGIFFHLTVLAILFRIVYLTMKKERKK